ncbi:uncharacterized protein J3D65DRAFT_470152 [Phyllosticta citribraziliensis]|uniref:Uncharacterized protein n=1 Tax=Phyllosticta citribraziliensis TaxID=989973 RepID=A0ABR1LJJ1_9PEZI
MLAIEISVPRKWEILSTASFRVRYEKAFRERQTRHGFYVVSRWHLDFNTVTHASILLRHCPNRACSACNGIVNTACGRCDTTALLVHARVANARNVNSTSPRWRTRVRARFRTEKSDSDNTTNAPSLLSFCRLGTGKAASFLLGHVPHGSLILPVCATINADLVRPPTTPRHHSSTSGLGFALVCMARPHHARRCVQLRSFKGSVPRDSLKDDDFRFTTSAQGGERLL